MKILISNNDNKPIYQQIYDQLSTQILQKELEPGSKLPSIRTAAKELRVSVITIKKTWELLEQNKLIYTAPGKGSFVSVLTDENLNMKKHTILEGMIDELLQASTEMSVTKEVLINIINNRYNKKET